MGVSVLEVAWYLLYIHHLYHKTNKAELFAVCVLLWCLFVFVIRSCVLLTCRS